MSARRSPSATLEREVIVSVVALYLLITITMLVIHFAQPPRAISARPSPTPSPATASALGT